MEGEGNRGPLSLSCLRLLTPNPCPLLAQQLFQESGFLGTLLLGYQLTKPPEKEESQKTVAVPSLSEAVPLTTAFSVLTGKAIEQMA